MIVDKIRNYIIVMDKYYIKCGDEFYYIYVLNNEKYPEYKDFYIKGENNANIEFQVGCKIEEENVEEIINNNLVDWVYFYNKDYNK